MIKMLLNCKTATKYFKERPEDLIWYKLYRNDRFIIYKKKGENIEKVLDVPEKPICLKFYSYFYKIGNTILNMKEVSGCYIKKIETRNNYYLIIEFKNDPVMYLDLEDNSRENVIKEQHQINLYLNKIRKGLI
jgi:hypothetical protein